jgi:O-antigen biosynthesis protein
MHSTDYDSIINSLEGNVMQAAGAIVSVIMPSYNSRFLQEAVDSVLAQTFDDFELIIVDCSTESGVLKVLETFTDPRVKIERRSGRHLPGSNRNFGIERALGEYILCVDADDMIVPTFLEEALFVFCCTDYSLVGTSCRAFGAVEKTARPPTHPTLEEVANGTAFFISTMFRRTLWCQLNGFIDTGLGSSHVPEDWDFWLRAMLSGAKPFNRRSLGLHYRRHAGSLTRQKNYPGFDEMRKKLRRKYQSLLPESVPSAPGPGVNIQEDGWRRLSFNRLSPQESLIILPERSNEVFCNGLMSWVVERANSKAEQSRWRMSVLATCPIDSYAEELIGLLRKSSVCFFSLPEFLEDSELWLEFAVYLVQSRQIETVLYGQNTFFIDKIELLETSLPNCEFNYIARYNAV